MPGIGRRRLIGSAATLSLHPSISARAQKPGAHAAPVAKTGNATDVYFGETVADPYRWMENPKDPDWLPYLKAQNNHNRAVRDTIPGRSELLRQIENFSGEIAITQHVQRAGGKLFYQQRPVGADNFNLFMCEKGSVRVLVNSTSMGWAAGHVSLDWWKASPDGALVAYGVSPNGCEESVLYVLVTALLTTGVTDPRVHPSTWVK